MAKLPTREEIEAAEKALKPYHLALGEVAHAWNHMQEQLGRLFCLVSGLDDSMGMRIWHVLKSDRSQRDLLEAATTAAARDDAWRKNFPKAKDDIDWLLKKVNAIADGRNSAVHAPMSAMMGGEAEITPLTWWGNPNAAKLRGKDILAEFEWYEKSADAIKTYAGEIRLALMRGQRTPWPGRPLLPTVKRRNGRPDRSHPAVTE